MMLSCKIETKAEVIFCHACSARHRLLSRFIKKQPIISKKTFHMKYEKKKNRSIFWSSDARVLRRVYSVPDRRDFGS